MYFATTIKNLAEHDSMADINSVSTSTLQRTRWFALPAAALFALVGAIMLWRRGQNGALVSTVPTVTDPIAVAVPVSIPQAKKTRKQSPFRWLLYLVATLFCAGVLLLLQNATPEIAAAIFILILLAALVYGTFLTAGQISRKIITIGTLLLYPRALLKAHTRSVSLVSIGIALSCSIASAILFRDALNYIPLLGQAAFMLMIACLAVGLVTLLKPNVVLAGRWYGMTASQDQPFNLGRALGGLVAAISGLCLLFLLAEINGNLLDSSLLSSVHHVVQFALLVFGVTLLVVGMGGRLRLPVMTRQEVLFLSGVLLLALIVRSVALDTVIHRYIDEINFMNAIQHMWANPDTPILVPFIDLRESTWIYPLLQSGISNIVGSGFAGLRLISAVFGVLGVAALYFLVRTLFHDKWLALIAALVLATLPAHIHFSRLGLYNIVDPLFGTLALAFLMRGLQSHNRSDYVIAGAALGLTQYFYEGGRLLYPPLLVAAFIVAWLLSGHRKADLIHGGYALLVAILVAAPIYYTLVGVGSVPTPRLNEEAVGGNLWTQLFANGQPIADVLRERFLYPLLMSISVPDQGWFYGGEQAFIILPLVPFFLLGIAYAIWHIRTPGIIVFLIWALITAFGNSLLRDNLWTPRYVVAFPALALFVAMGIYATLHLVWSQSKFVRWRYIAIASLSILLATAQTVYYFRDQVPYFMRQFQQEEDWNDAFFRMFDLPANTHVHFIMRAPVWGINMQAFVGYYRLDLAVDALRPDELTVAYLKRIMADQTVQHVFFVNPRNTESLTLLRHYFTLSAPKFSPYDIPKLDQLGLYKVVEALQ